MRERLWVALDVDTVKEAETLLERLAGVGVGAKIGSQLYTAAGPAAVEMALHRGVPVFLDLKYHDIPNTVAGALRVALGAGWVIVTPGVRPGATHVGGPGGHVGVPRSNDDQKRVATPRAAIGAGADAIVIGRPITAAGDPGAAARAILEEIAAAGN